MSAVLELAPLRAADGAAVEALLDAAFGPDRRGRTAYRLREGAEPVAALSFAAFDEGGALAGSLQCWPILLAVDGGNCHSLVLLGPVAVAPMRQGEGIGRGLMCAALAAADDVGVPALALVGDAPYYGRFGFDASRTAGWRLPGPWEPSRLLARFAPGAALPARGLLVPALPRAADWA